MRHLKTLASALAIVAVLVMATDYIAMAATGKPIILGHVNKSGKTTTIQSSKGAALKLKVDADKPPLKVNSDTMVKKLNVAKVGGKSASQLGVRTNVEKFNMTGNATTQVAATLPAQAAGTYLVTYSVWLYASTSVSGYCQLSVDAGTRAPVAVPAIAGNFFIANSSTVVKLSATETPEVRCNFSSATNITTYQSGLATFTPIDVQSGATLPRLGRTAPAKAANR